MRFWIALLSIVLLAACGVEGKGDGSNANNGNNLNNVNNANNLEQCLLDTDCNTGEVCEGELCQVSCITAAECGVGEICVPRQDGAGAYCVVGMSGNNANPNNVNNVNNANNVDATFIVQISDTTATDCDSSDPGADLVYVSLEENDGSILGFGSLIDDGTVGDNNEFNLGINLDGTAPNSLNICPDFSAETVMSLGCGGFVTLEFLDDTGSRVGAVSGQQIHVFEFGSQCSTGSTADEYDIYLCTDPSNTPGSCTVNIGGGSGEIAATVP